MPNQNKNLSDDLALEADGGTKEYLNVDPPKKPAKEENISIAKSKMVLAKKLLANIKENNERLIQLLSGFLSPEDEASISIAQMSDENFDSGEASLGEARIIEGVVDGENMIGPDGKQYPVPANYASKSKLVEGDVLKLTIAEDGSFIYKQIGPVERRKILGILTQDEKGEYRVIAEGKPYRVLLASLTYFKAETGDQVTVVLPKDKDGIWAAVENVIKNGQIATSMPSLSRGASSDETELEEL